MQRSEIDQLLGGTSFAGGDSSPILIETHISWVILAGQHAYKIKKPVNFSFLDFSTLAKRKYYCTREVELNRRLAAEMYLGVVPILTNSAGISLAPSKGEIIDYAVLMKRMDSAMEMDKLLATQKVSNEAIEKLAAKVAVFHQQAIVITREIPVVTLKERFNDLENSLPFAQKYLGDNYAAIIRNSIKKSDEFLDKYQFYITGRAAKGFIRDGHGDLHSGNIFLYTDPVIFDCIEFNDEMRHLDVLDEVAFLCMDLEAYGRQDLSCGFYKNYLRFARLTESVDLNLLFHYYKCYRANIRVKVNLLNAIQTNGQIAFDKKIKAASVYLRILKRYQDQY